MDGTTEPPLFPLGRLAATPGALAAMRAAGESPPPPLSRHRRGDFGRLDPGDVRLQTLALRHEHDPEKRERMMSVYPLADGTVVRVITGADRSSTCVLLPDEY